MTLEIGIYDHTTGENVVREMNADELAELEQTRAEFALVKQAQIAEAASLAESKGSISLGQAIAIVGSSG